MRPSEHINGYVILRNIGEGGMSVVYLARDHHDGSQVVVKQLRDEYASDVEFVSRFQQEARIMGALQHPNLARVMGYIEQNGQCLLVEEYLPGGSLAERMANGEKISEKQALLWCRDALLAVDYAHRDGILHRDLKPGNLMFDAKGNIKITDFGIAKVFGAPRLTRTRSEMGTPAYMSPEQIRSPQKAYHLTDVYSMGVVLYELLTQKVPFDGDSDFEIRQAVVKKPPPAPRRLNPNISVELEQIILKAMEKDQWRRYGGCAEFASRIDAYLKKESPAPKPKGWAWVREYPGLTAVLMLTAVVFAFLLLWRIL